MSELDASVARLAEVADRLDQLADTAELMGDESAAAWLRGEALHRRVSAMHLLDG